MSQPSETRGSLDPQPSTPATPSMFPRQIEVKPKPSRPIFPILMGLIVIGLIGAAWYFGLVPGRDQGQGAADEGGQEASAPAAETPAPASAPALAAETVSRQDLDALSQRLDELQTRLDALPKPEPPPDLGPLETKVNALAKVSDELDALSKTVKTLDDRIADNETSVGRVRSDVGALRAEVDLLKGDVAAMKSAAAARAVPAAGLGSSLARGGGRYKQRKYAEARDVFQSLQKSHPNDARVWYYSALATGFATGQWTGEANRLAQKGVELERAGTPGAAAIDAAFADLVTANGKDWLAAYRARVRR